MPKKTTILIVILAIITGFLIYLAIKSDNAQTNVYKTQAEITPTPTIQPYTTFSFSPPQLDMTNSSAAQSVDVTIDTAGKPVSTAQIEFLYDPKVITKVSFAKAKTPFFGVDQNVLIDKIDPTQGRASYVVGIPLQGAEKIGNGTVVSLKFTVVKVAEMATSTISFTSKSAATTLSTQKPILQNTTPLTIILRK